MEAWLDNPAAGGKLFDPTDNILILPGDLLGFRVGRCVHHLAIALRAGAIFHVVEPIGAVIGPTIPHRWEKRLERIWRPIP
jgi:cell wall-associated NlpC family hydrolase